MKTYIAPQTKGIELKCESMLASSPQLKDEVGNEQLSSKRIWEEERIIGGFE